MCHISKLDRKRDCQLSGASVEMIMVMLMIMMMLIMMLTLGIEIEVLSPKVGICKVGQKTSNEQEA